MRLRALHPMDSRECEDRGKGTQDRNRAPSYACGMRTECDSRMSQAVPRLQRRRSRHHRKGGTGGQDQTIYRCGVRTLPLGPVQQGS
eukprot:6195590-Pleurochrysis_carterae.AAC.4